MPIACRDGSARYNAHFTALRFRGTGTDGVARVTRPINLIGGGQVKDLSLWFEQGRVTRVEAARGSDLVRAQMATDPGASRLMIGGPEVDVFGVDESGDEVSVIARDAWVLD